MIKASIGLWRAWPSQTSCPKAGGSPVLGKGTAMHGKSIWSKKAVPRRHHRAPDAMNTEIDRVDVGDWAFAQDDNGYLIIHNVITGNRVVLADPNLERGE